MAVEPLDDARRIPDEDALRRFLGPRFELWSALRRRLEDESDGLDWAWKFYGAKYGWQMKVSRGKRAVVYLIPRRGGFTAALALNDKAVAALRSADLPAALVREIANGRKLPEGRAARIDVDGVGDVRTVLRLVSLKLRA